MFGRKREAAPRYAPTDQEIRAAIAEHLAVWAETLKRPYQAAGFDLEGAIKHVNALESRASGSSGHPWPPGLKVEMVRRINGASDLPEVRKRVQALQIEYEKVLAGELTLEEIAPIEDTPRRRAPSPAPRNAGGDGQTGGDLQGQSNQQGGGNG